MTSSRLWLGLLVAACCAACDAGSDPGDTSPTQKVTPTPAGPLRPADLGGRWARLLEVPGSSEHWSLSATDSVVSGTGTWTGEACCGGTLSVAGYVSHDSLHVDIMLTVTAGVARPPIQEHFDGVLASPTLLAGNVSYGGSQAQPAQMQKY